jgi:hypothetical protein
MNEPKLYNVQPIAKRRTIDKITKTRTGVIVTYTTECKKLPTIKNKPNTESLNLKK